jgi:glycosyltransferase involved in cell wall biosynthesis
VGNEQHHLAGEDPKQGVREAAGDPPEPPQGIEKGGTGIETDKHRCDDATGTPRRDVDAAVRVGIDGKCLQPPRAGVARYLEGLLQGLSELGASGLDIEVLQPERPRRTLPWVLWDLQRATGRGFELFHFAFYYPPLRPRCPYTVAIHDVLVLEHPEWFPRAWANPIRRLLPRGARRAAAVIASGNAAAETIAARCGVARERIRVIPYGLDPARFAPPDTARVAESVARLGLRQPFLLQVGSLEPRRGIDLAVAATAALRSEGRQVDLVVVGEQRARVVALAAPPPWVRLIGRVDDADLPALYAGAAAVLAPSRGEGFDLPVLEALGSGAVVVASDIDVHLEHFAGAVETFRSGDARALATACRLVLDDAERVSALRAAGSCLAARFTWRECAQRHVELWREVAQR